MTNVPILVGDILRRNARHFPKKSAIFCSGIDVSWEELDSSSNKLANALRASEMVKGDRLVIMANNSTKWVQSYFASSKAGTASVIVPTILPSNEKIAILKATRPKAILFDHEQHSFISSLNQDFAGTKYISFSNDPPRGCISFDNILASYPDNDPQTDLSNFDICDILFTTGTTGFPKGPVFTHQAVIWKAISSALTYNHSRESVCLATGPLFHAGALSTSLLPTAFVAGSMIVLDKFDAKLILSTIEARRVTHTAVIAATVPRILKELSANSYKLESVKTLIIAGGGISRNNLEILMGFFGNAEVKYTYGTTEGLVSCLNVKEGGKEGPVGKEAVNSQSSVVYGNEFKIIDDEGTEVPMGAVGELVFRSPGMPSMYWGQKDNQDLFVDGWIRTGDLCKVDQWGFLRFVDRLKEIIKSGGENIYSPEIEDVLYTHPAILEAAVIGVPDEDWGEAVKAIVKLREGVVVSAEEVIEYCKNRLAKYRAPKSVEFVTEFPRSPVGKILKKQLKGTYIRRKQDAQP